MSIYIYIYSYDRHDRDLLIRYHQTFQFNHSIIIIFDDYAVSAASTNLSLPFFLRNYIDMSLFCGLLVLLNEDLKDIHHDCPVCGYRIKSIDGHC